LEERRRAGASLAGSPSASGPPFRAWILRGGVSLGVPSTSAASEARGGPDGIEATGLMAGALEEGLVHEALDKEDGVSMALGPVVAEAAGWSSMRATSRRVGSATWGSMRRTTTRARRSASGVDWAAPMLRNLGGGTGPLPGTKMISVKRAFRNSFQRGLPWDVARPGRGDAFGDGGGAGEGARAPRRDGACLRCALRGKEET